MAKYTKVENVRMLLTLLKKHGIRHIVTSPGGTNIPIVHGLQQDSYFKCYSVVDERSAMYFAIGLQIQVGEPVATTCTSAQATRNYLPGLTEAYYKHIPILAITCSKHARYTYQECMQAPDQTSLPVDSVKRTFSLPYISNPADRVMCERMINAAILELTHHRTGPVQLNVPIIDSERLAFVETELPNTRFIQRYDVEQDWNICLAGKKIMVVAGECRSYTQQERKLIQSFLQNHNAILYTNHLSNLHINEELQGNLLLSAMSQALFDEQFAPDVLITIGGQTGDYPVYGKINGNKTLEHWRVSPDGEVVDPYDKLTKVFQCSNTTFFKRMALVDATNDHTFYQVWNNAIKKLKLDVKLPLSNLFVAQQLHEFIPAGSTMNYAILNSLRSWLMFPISKIVNGYSPVAAFGIDGGMSMALGHAYDNKDLSFFITGDLAFFYDMNSLGIRGLGNNIRIILVNNNRGAEFAMYGNPNNIDLATYISAENHNGSAEGWCTANNFKYINATTKEDVLKHIPELVSPSNQSIVLEVMTKTEDEEAALKIMLSENFSGTEAEGRKGKIKKILGETIINLLHEITGK